MMDPTTLDDHAFAVWAAERAGTVLLDVRAGAEADGLEGKALKDAGDAAAQAELDRVLTQHRPGDAVLSEEARRRQVAARPPGGSGSSTRSTAPGSSPSRRATTGPCTSRCGRTATSSPAPSPSPPWARPSAPGGPACCPPRTSTRPRIAVSRSRPPAFVEALAAELDAELVPMGSAGVKVMSVVRDVADAYVHAGGQYQWDNAAPVAVARAAGLHCSRVDGSPHRLQRGRHLAARPHRVPPRAGRGDRRVRTPPRHGLTRTDPGIGLRPRADLASVAP